MSALPASEMNTGLGPAAEGTNSGTFTVKQHLNTSSGTVSAGSSGDGVADGARDGDAAFGIADFISRVAPWPAPGAPGVVNIHWRMKHPKSGKLIWAGHPTTSPGQFVSLVDRALQRPATFTEIYYCLSLQGRVRVSKNNTPTVIRSQADALALRSIWLDIDVKDPPKGYATLYEAKQALAVFLKAYKLPFPTALVESGGGLHVYWVSDKDLPPDEWRPYATGLRAAAVQHGLRCDGGVTVDSARILRVPGTFNNKIAGQPRPVRLLSLEDGNINFAKALGHLTVMAASAPAVVTATVTPIDMSAFAGKKPSAAWASLDPNESLAAGIEHNQDPLDPTPIFAKGGCPYFRDAIATHGRDAGQGLWMLTVLASTFWQNGAAFAHELSNSHPGYKAEETDQMIERKTRERAQRGLGWPSCAAFEREGATQCMTCRYKGQIKSPLNLSATVSSSAALPQPAIWSAASMKVSFNNLSHRQWLYGTYLIRGEITVLASPGGVGKTAIAVGMAVEIATGLSVVGQTLWCRDQKVLYIIAEDERTELNRRVFAFCRAHPGVMPQLPPARLFVAGVDDPQVRRISFLRPSTPNTSTLDDVGFAVLEDALRQLGPDVVVLDPLVHLCRNGNMNDNAAMAAVMGKLKDLAREYECAILIVHHTKKGADPGDAEAVSGAASIVNLARCAIMPVVLGDKECLEAGGLPSERSSYLKLINPKANFAPHGQEQVYRLHNVELPNAAPPVYPHGDRVQAIALPDPLAAQSTLNLEQQARAVILPLVARGKDIGGALHPYTANNSGSNAERALLPDAMSALEAATSRPWEGDDLREITKKAISAMLKDGTIVKKLVKELMAKPGNSGRTQGLAVNRALAPVPDTGWVGDFVGDYQPSSGAERAVSVTDAASPTAPSADAVN